MTPARTPLQVLGSALATVAVAVAVWWFVEWRSAAPPPPQVKIPDVEMLKH